MSYDMGQLWGAEINLMEMTEGEYTHLQQVLLQTHLDGPATVDHNGADVRFPTAIFGLSVTTQPATTKSDTGSGKVFPSPSIQAIDLSTSNDEQCVRRDLRLNETVDMEELDMVTPCSGGGGNAGETTPTTCGEVPGPVLNRAKRESLTEAPGHSYGPSLNRPQSSARVCLEKRFSCVPEDVPRQQDNQMAVLTNFLTMLQQSSESQEASIHPEMQKWMKSDRTNPIELSNPYGGALFNPISGVCGQKKISRSNLTEEQQWVKVKEEAVPSAPIKRTRSRMLRDPIVDPPLEGTRAAVEAGRTGRKKRGTATDISRCRENHNSKERDRRRRIRRCCDELNTLAPFCRPDTDKATTLQWTTAFLKHIQQVYGDSVKENFQSTFCGKTGTRLRPSRDADQLHVHQEMAGTASPALAAEQ